MEILVIPRLYQRKTGEIFQIYQIVLSEYSEGIVTSILLRWYRQLWVAVLVAHLLSYLTGKTYHKGE